MFIYILFSCQRKIHTEDIYKRFQDKFKPIIRNCVVIDRRAKSLELIFRTETVAPFIEFVQEKVQDFNIVKSSVEFAYDDGGFHFLHIHPDKIIDEDDWSDYTEYVYLDVLTGIRNNIDRAVAVWAEELKASAEITREKAERIKAAKARFEYKSDNTVPTPPIYPKTFKARTDDSENVPKVKYSLPPNLTKRTVIEFIDRLNNSGEVIIPFYILRDEFQRKSKREIPKSQIIQLRLDYDRSIEKSKQFSLFKESLEELGLTPQE